MSDDDFDGYSFAITAAVGEGVWDVRSFDDPFENPQTSVKAVRQLRAEGAAFAMLCVDDDYFVVVRPVPGGARWFISDATMAVDDDFAADVLEEAGCEIPDIDPQDLDDVDGYADGDFDIFADLGVSEDQLAAYVDNDEDYPSDMLLRIAGEWGFGDELEEEINS
ncbi:MAG: tRNA adenosine deaminase-associated protein [Corynebacterium sp.]|uniref:tRNA adenosine deaminase-associated protein n=1 Tax=Corynebacterium sp. TaxID=1720 RepID=UPI00181E7AC0|nr:tRNA adenosine deaminase-associated protein [Corynebacterium sp.]NWO17917.1 tRNA adenosine deaminase-associated protein [Corynebacterium sp.]